MSGPRRLIGRWRRCAPATGYALAVLLLFWGPLVEGRVLFFRDVALQYYPDYVFAAASLRGGVWPLWNPTADAGAPFLLAYPVDLVLLAAFGARATLRFGVPLHLFVAMLGARHLARRLGAGASGAWAAGLFYGTSGYVLAAVNLLQIFQAAAWMPWVLSALALCLRKGTPRGAAYLASLAALQASTLSAETVLQTAVAGGVLFGGRALVRRWPLLVPAGALALALAAPALAGLAALLEGTRRAAGFAAGEALAWSAGPVVLLEAFVPRLFGDVHTFSRVGFWGQDFFEGGYPYMISLYVGPGVLLLAARAGAGGVARRLWVLALLGVLLSAGGHGPLAGVLEAARVIRTPVKFFLLSTLALCLLAGVGLERRRPRRVPVALLSLPLLLALAGLLAFAAPDLPGRLFGALLPQLKDPGALHVVRHAWPSFFVPSGLLAAASLTVLGLAPRLKAAAALLVGCDLLVVNASLNPSAPARFYELHDSLRGLVSQASAAGRHRWFSYGVANSPGVAFAPELFRINADSWLYYFERQSLWSRTKTLDGLEGAFDEDRAGWAPEGATLSPAEVHPALYRRIHDRLRGANVRWVVSFQELPADLVSPRGRAQVPGVLTPLVLGELRDPLPRAFWARDCAVGAAPAEGAGPGAPVHLAAAPANWRCGGGTGATGRVEYERVDAHTVRLRATGDPGFVVVLDGFHRSWQAFLGDTKVPVLCAVPRYLALPTPGGARDFVLRFEPRWREPALVSCLIGLIMAAATVFWTRPNA
ncbi:MAG TPA: hypothetical protein VII13_22025 [Vicinamibacteria bacterium]